MRELPSGWIEAPPIELLEQSIGGVWGKPPGEQEADVTVVRVADFRDDGTINLATAPRRSITSNQLLTRKLCRDDLLLEKSGGGPTKPVGRVVRGKQTSGSVVPTNFVQLLRPSSHVDADYLFWWLWWSHLNGSSAEFQRATTNIRNLRVGDYLNRKAPVPPLSEQRRIVAAIEEQFSRLNAADASLDQARSRLQGLGSAVVTSCLEGDWPLVRWKDAGRSQNGRAFPSKDYSLEGIQLLRPGNLSASGRVEWKADNSRRLPERYAEQHPRFLVGANEVVMNLTAQSLKDEFLGRVCLTGAGERCLLNQRIARLTPNDAEPRFVLYVFKSRRFRDFVKSLNTGSLIQHMFTSQLDEFELPVPPLEEQRRIVAEVEERLSVIDAMRASIARAERRSATLRRSILERAFRGELVPQDPSDEPASVLLARIRAGRELADALPRRRRVSA
ncbi:MAG: restriction endonuclease subunit S [Actinobacteria bacterium]|nr:restriction endonuclease subunit S [Actinomycetota bacterium]